MVNTLKPLFLVGVLAAAAYGVFTIMGGGAPSKPPVELDGGWGGGPMANSPGMPPPLTAPPSGVGEPIGMAPMSAGPGGQAPPFNPGAAATAAPPFQPLGEAPTPDYAPDNQVESTSIVTPPLPIDVGDNSAVAQPPLTAAPPAGDTLGSSAATPASASAPYGQTNNPYGQTDAYGNVTPQVNEFGHGDAQSVGPASPDGGPAAQPPVTGGFAVALATIHAQLQQQQVAEAQLALSQWYGDPSLSPAEQEQLLALLDQLTGTVIYSRQHYVEQAYITGAGDTLESVAEQFSVPAELLANINGVSVSDALLSGSELKVVRGPIAASLDLDNYRLTLWLDQRYAGRFAVGIGSEQPITPGDYMVETKIKDPTYYGSELTVAKDDLANPLGEHWIGLGGNFGLHGTIDPQSVGAATTQGCVRLSARDVQDVFDILSIGSRVIVHQSADPTGETPTAQGATPQAPTAQTPPAPNPTARF